LDHHPDRVLTVTSVYEPDSGYYIEDVRLEELQTDKSLKARRNTVLHSGQVLTARGGTKYYKTSDSLKADLARLFSRNAVPMHLDLYEVGWWGPFEDSLDSD